MFTKMFDELTKQVATVTSRRQLFKVLAGAVAAVAGTLLSSRAAEAAEEHTCCVYSCFDGSFSHQCIHGHLDLCPDLKGCGMAIPSYTTKCSDCGAVVTPPCPTKEC